VTGVATAPRSAEAASPDPSTATGPTLRSSVRRGRGPVLVAVAVALAGAVVGLLSLVPTGGYLDPDGYDPSGSRAVVELLRDGGVEVERVELVDEALTADAPGTTLVVPRPEALTVAELEQLAGRQGRLVVVSPSDVDLEALDLPAEVDGTAPVDPRDTGCVFEPAQRAGPVELGGTLYRSAAEGAVGCYPHRGRASLLVLPEQRVVVLGAGRLLTNDRLDDEGNAALALGLLGSGDRVAWLVPDPTREIPPGERRPLTSLLPESLVLGVVQLGVALVVLALWRARRLGRVVEEPLPVVVRAAEAVEGRGRLYRAAGARDTAAEALRAGVRARLSRRLGLPAGEDRAALVAGAAARTGRDPGPVDGLLYGAPPADDAGLVRLADALRALERAVTDPAVSPPRQTPPTQEVAGP